jgi:recombination protein RecA
MHRGRGRERFGSWISYKGQQLAQGRDAAKEALRADQTLYDELEVSVKTVLDEEAAKRR